MSGPEAISRRALLGGLGALTAAAALPRWARAEAAGFSLRNATLLTHEGRRLVDHGLRVVDGRVVEIGPSARFGAEALDLGGAWVCPGFTDAGCRVGLVEVDLEAATRDDDESTSALTPDARVRDGYNVRSEVIPVTRANGITSVLVHPTSSNLISGQAALFRTVGETVEQALVLAPAALCINLGRAATGSGRSGAPASRMGVAMKLRELFEGVELPEEGAAPAEEGKKKARKAAKGAASPKAKDVPPDEEVDAGQRALRDLRRGRLPALIQADRADDILAAVELTKTWGLRGVLLGGAEAWMVADRLAAAKMPVFLGPLNAQPDSFERLEARYENAARLHAAGVSMAFRTGAAHFSRGLPSLAGLIVAYGLPHEAAIRALTRGPWEALGLPGGELAEGAEATFFVVDGDPLQPRYPIRRMWVAGREVSLASRQSRLYETYRALR